MYCVRSGAQKLFCFPNSEHLSYGVCLWEPLSRQSRTYVGAKAQKSELRVRTGLMKDPGASPGFASPEAHLPGSG